MGQKDHNGSCPCVNIDAMFNSCKSQCREENPVLHIEKFPFLVLARNTIMLKHLIIHFLLHYLSSGRSHEVKNKGKFQTISYKIAHGRLQGVANFGNLVADERWSQEGFDCTYILKWIRIHWDQMEFSDDGKPTVFKT